MATPRVFHLPIMAASATKQLPRRWSLCQSWPELDDSRWPQTPFSLQPEAQIFAGKSLQARGAQSIDH